MTIYRISNQNRAYNLIPEACNRKPYDWSHVVRVDLICLNGEYYKAANYRCKPDICEPDAVLRCDHVRSTWLRPLTAHPKVAAAPSQLFTEDRADDEANKLQADLLGVEAEFRREDLGDFHSAEDSNKVEYDRVRDGWNDDTRVREKFDGREELTDGNRFLADPPKVEILALEGGLLGIGFGLATTIERFRREEEVEDELNSVRYGKDPVYPFPAAGVVGYKSHDERTCRWPVIAR